MKHYNNKKNKKKKKKSEYTSAFVTVFQQYTTVLIWVDIVLVIFIIIDAIQFSGTVDM